MIGKALHLAFRKLCVNQQCYAVVRYHCTQQIKHHRNLLPLIQHGTTLHPNSNFKPGAVNIDFQFPREHDHVKNIMDFPTIKLPKIDEFPLTSDIPIPLPRTDKSINVPPNTKIIEKQAVRLIVIRRRMMKKHKRKKLRKRMYYVWLKMKQKREQKKEKAFQVEMLAQLNDAEKFDAEVYVKERIRLLTKERLPKTYKGEVLPEAMIRQFLAEKRAKEEAKRNRPRLSLD